MLLTCNFFGPPPGGALKPTDVDQLWVHVTCAWYQPKVSFPIDETMEPAMGVLSIPSEYFKKVRILIWYFFARLPVGNYCMCLCSNLTLLLVYVFFETPDMCNMQADAWGLHPVLQVLYFLSCNVCVESRISHGGRLPFVVAIMIILCSRIFLLQPAQSSIIWKQKCMLSAI
jgi:hypothetical protein